MSARSDFVEVLAGIMASITVRVPLKGHGDVDRADARKLIKKLRGAGYTILPTPPRRRKPPKPPRENFRSGSDELW